MKAKTIKGKSPAEIRTALQQAISDAYQPSLAIVFLSIQQDIDAVMRVFHEMRINVFGASTAGEFIDGDVQEGSIVAMLLDVNLDYYRVELIEADANNHFEAAEQLAQFAKLQYKNPSIPMAVSSWGAQSEVALRGMESVLGEQVNLYGAVAGDDMTLTGAFVFTNKKSSKNGIVMLLLDGDKITMKGVATSGWKPIGTQRNITKSEGNVVYTIENEPAFDVYQKYLDEEITDLKQENKWLLRNNAYFPILIQRNGAPPLIRTGTYSDPENHTVHFAGAVPEGSVFRFTQPPDFEVIDKVISEADHHLKMDGMSTADAVILFSCISRRTIFGPLISEEIDGIKNIWKAPLAGFFSYGEIGLAGNRNELHNTTCCVVVLKEK